MDAEVCKKGGGKWNPALKECWKGKDLVLQYPKIGLIFENWQGIWEAKDCECSGFIDENYDAVITANCESHKNLKSSRSLPGDFPWYKRVKW